MYNPFRKSEEKIVQEAKKDEMDYGLAAQAIGNPGEAADSQILAERREVLVELSKWQQDRSGVMKNLFYKLAGVYYSDTKNQLIYTKWDKGYCSLRGAAKMVNFIENLDHNVMLANWEQKYLILTLRDAIAHPLRRFIFMNHKSLGIKILQAEYVFWNIMNTIEPNYWRGWNDGERRKDKEIIKVHEVRNPYYRQKTKGIFGMET